jgi:hypothetical protein
VRLIEQSVFFTPEHASEESKESRSNEAMSLLPQEKAIDIIFD